MFRKLIGYCRRLFQSKGFRRAVRILVWVFLAYVAYLFVLCMKILLDIGVPFSEALPLLLKLKLLPEGYTPPSVWIALGLAFGLIWFFHRRDQKKEAEEAKAKEEEPAEASAPAQEEEFIEPPRYQSR